MKFKNDFAHPFPGKFSFGEQIIPVLLDSSYDGGIVGSEFCASDIQHLRARLSYPTFLLHLRSDHNPFSLSRFCQSARAW